VADAITSPESPRPRGDRQGIAAGGDAPMQLVRWARGLEIKAHRGVLPKAGIAVFQRLEDSPKWVVAAGQPGPESAQMAQTMGDRTAAGAPRPIGAAPTSSSQPPGWRLPVAAAGQASGRRGPGLRAMRRTCQLKGGRGSALQGLGSSPDVGEHQGATQDCKPWRTGAGRNRPGPRAHQGRQADALEASRVFAAGVPVRVIRPPTRRGAGRR